VSTIYIYIYIYIYSSFSTSLFFNFSPFSNNSTSPCSTIDTLRLIKNSSFSSVRTYIYIHPFKVYSFLVSFLFQSRWRMTLRALEMALSVGNILVSCSIMWGYQLRGNQRWTSRSTTAWLHFWDSAMGITHKGKFTCVFLCFCLLSYVLY